MPENTAIPHKPSRPHYTSFILRCRVNEKGRIQCQLVEVGSGISHALCDLAVLPELVKKLVSKWDPPNPPLHGDKESNDC